MRKRDLGNELATASTESIKQKKRKIPKNAKIVFDTNLVIRDIDQIKTLATKESSRYTLIIPLAVVTELSGLSSTLETAQRAYTSIINLLEQGMMFMYTGRGTKIKERFGDVVEEWETGMTADDVIVGICVGLGDVWLCTGDKNMRIKAMGRNVNVVEKVSML